MIALIAGAAGQLGRALQATAPAGATVIAPDEARFDILDAAAVDAIIAETRPTHLFNAAAYTAVDKAETDADTAHRVNATAVATLATAARAHGAKLVHISTDFVFDGTASTPYPPDATPNPLGLYGATKRAGETAALANPDALIVRTAWVYAAKGNNFVHTMLRLMRERPELRVVADQVGTPTHATGLARALWALAAANARGIFHWTDAGVCSWYDFAVAIQEEALALGLLATAIPILPIRTTDYPTPARRPAYSVLDKTDTWALTGPALPWRAELRLCLQDIRDAA
ncbi:dTDP-4-dehydrorhamnose reductase [Sandaracinobacteroides saxicola]|uniref:dTDP-4-dehydrorhamnose reductase n=1 Tax=Sandaracinobacteroides saxicola TaxID=2759707 RepID=A0A7G5IFD5_9SPHN|nr:dTDP-4-dehydrorhamnose reductase [Sandaracinobacteroides saxicola]QMW22077.1 dTDP-4-dehydrorhamnose reductase [Sandaracinobacteroides saxicola]